MGETDRSSADAAPSAGFWCALLGSALALRLVVSYVALADMALVSDAQSYSLEAVALLDHFPGTQAYFWPPGMPYLLAGVYALLGSELWVSRLVACTLGTAQVALSTALAREALGDPRGARAAGWLAAMYPPAVLMSGQTYSQHLAGVSLTAIALCAIRLWRTERPAAGAAAGIAWGIGCITRPSMLAVGPALLMLGALGWRRERRGGDARAPGGTGSVRPCSASGWPPRSRCPSQATTSDTERARCCRPTTRPTSSTATIPTRRTTRPAISASASQASSIPPCATTSRASAAQPIRAVR